MDPYAVLGVKREAGGAEIKTAYRRLMLQRHPDKGGDVEMAKQINAAYDMLTKKQPAPVPVVRPQPVVVRVVRMYGYAANDATAGGTVWVNWSVGTW